MKELGQQQEPQYPKKTQEDYSKPSIQHCQFPICPIHSNSKYCIRRAVGSLVPEVIKKVYNIPTRSKKRIKEQPIYVGKVKAAAAINDNCEIQSPVCTGKMTGFNHPQKRSPSNWLDDNNHERSCNECNGYVETHTEWAKENGHFISKFKK